MKALILWAILLGACSKKQEEAPPAEPPPAISQDEVKRGVDACADYTKRVCTCKAPEHVEACKLAPAYSDAVDMARGVVFNPETKRKDAVQAAASIRNTVKKCVEEAAKLAAAGCP
jgi:hypothetical protein